MNNPLASTLYDTQCGWCENDGQRNFPHTGGGTLKLSDEKPQPPDKFVQLPIRVLKNSAISDGAARLYTVLQSYNWGDKVTCFPSQKLLCSDLGISRMAVHRRLVELRKAGLLTWKVRGLCKSNMYMLHPTGCNENATPDIPDSLHPDVTQPLPELDEVELYEDNIALNTSCLMRNARAREAHSIGTEEAEDSSRSESSPAASVEPAVPTVPSVVPKALRPPKREPLFKADGSLPSFGKPITNAVSSDGTRTMLAGLSLDVGVRLAKLHKKWATTSEEARSWPTIEIDYLLAWEKRYPKATGVRWPSYSSTSAPNAPGRAGFKAGAAFYGIMADLHGTYGYERLRDYFVFCVQQWDRLLAHVGTTEDFPNPMLIAKHANTWMPWFDAKFVPSIRPTDWRGPLSALTEKPSEEPSNATSHSATSGVEEDKFAELQRKFDERREEASRQRREREERARLTREAHIAARDAELERFRARRKAAPKEPEPKFCCKDVTETFQRGKHFMTTLA